MAFATIGVLTPNNAKADPYCDAANNWTLGNNWSGYFYDSSTASWKPASNTLATWVSSATGGVKAIWGPDGVYHEFATDESNIFAWDGYGLSNPAWCWNYSYPLAAQMYGAMAETWQRLVDHTSSFCLIENFSCTNDADKAGRILDGVNGARFNQAECMQRATDYYNYCGGGVHRATFRSGDFNNVVQTFVAQAGCTDGNAINYNSAATENDGTCYYTTTAISNPTGNNCQLAITSCPNHPGYATTFFDTYNGAKNSLAGCLQRANDYSGTWCGNSDSNPVTATYLNGSTVVGSRTVPTQAVTTTTTASSSSTSTSTSQSSSSNNSSNNLTNQGSSGDITNSTQDNRIIYVP